MTMSAPCIARVNRLRLRTSPTKYRRLSASGYRAWSSLCLSSSREKIRIVASGHASVARAMKAPPKDPVPPVRRMVEPFRSMWSPSCLMAPPCSDDLQHPLQCHLRPLCCVGVDGDAVDHSPLDELVEHPGQVGEVDAVHRGARADQRVEREDGLVGVLMRQTVREVDLGADTDGRAGRR